MSDLDDLVPALHALREDVDKHVTRERVRRYLSRRHARAIDVCCLVQPGNGGIYPLVPFCAHMIADGERIARAYRYDLGRHRYRVFCEGLLVSENGTPVFRAESSAPVLRPGDRVSMVSPYREDPASGVFTGPMDNAGGVAALAVAAPVLARAGVDALLAFPDEEEGPVAPGNQMIGRGGSRLISLLPAPELDS